MHSSAGSPPHHPHHHHHHSHSHHNLNPNPNREFSETSSSVAAADGMTYIESRYMYNRNSRAIGVLWAIFSLCFAIINAVVFVQPQWLGDTATSRGTGYFGLWRSCRLLQDGQDLICAGRLDDFGSIQTAAFRAATVFVGLSVCISAACVLAMTLFFFMHSSTVFHVCGWMQLSCAICMLVGVLVFPIGWDTPMVREVCGHDSDSYALGQCGIRWAFILALIGVVDCLVLSILAFVLGTRYVKQLPNHYLPNGTKYKGEVNSGFMNHEYLSNKKLIASLQPQLSGSGKLHAYSGTGGSQLNANGYLAAGAYHGSSMQGPPPPPPPPPVLPSTGLACPSSVGLTDVERYSEYSQRTSRSSYKSSSGAGSSSARVLSASNVPSFPNSHFTNF